MIKRIYRSIVPPEIKLSLYRVRRKIVRGAIFYLRYPFIEKYLNNRIQVSSHYWLFVMGCTNSGTTILTRIIEKNPMIRSLPHEGRHLSGSLPLPKKFGCSRLWGNRLDIFRWTESSNFRSVNRIKFDWSEYYDSAPGIYMEKSPTNALRSRWMQRHFSPCKFIMMVRNPYAVCEGVKRRTGCKIEDAATHWLNVNKIMMEDSKHLKHKILIPYEDLVDNTSKVISELNHFLEITPPLDHSVSSGEFKINENTSELKNFNNKSISQLSKLEIRTISSTIGSIVGKMGYSTI